MSHATLMQVAALSKLIAAEAAHNVSNTEKIPIVGLFLNASIASIIGTLAVLHARSCSKSQFSASIYCAGRPLAPQNTCDSVQVGNGLGMCRAAFMPLDCSWPFSKLKAVIDDACPILVLWADKECHGELIHLPLMSQQK